MAVQEVEVAFDKTGIGTSQVVKGTGVTKIVVLKFFTYCNGANDVTWQDSDGMILMPVMSFGAKQGFVFDKDADRTPWIIVAPGKDLMLKLSAATQVVGKLWYWQG